MLTEQQIKDINAYKETFEKTHELNNKIPLVYQLDDGRYIRGTINEEEELEHKDRRVEITKEEYDELDAKKKLIESERDAWRDKLDKLYSKIEKLSIEIKNPESLIGARVITGYRSKFVGVFIDDLLHITLSEVKQTGIVHMPYSFDAYGKATKTHQEQEYHIVRKNGVVSFPAWQII